MDMAKDASQLPGGYFVAATFTRLTLMTLRVCGVEMRPSSPTDRSHGEEVRGGGARDLVEAVGLIGLTCL